MPGVWAVRQSGGQYPGKGLVHRYRLVSLTPSASKAAGSTKPELRTRAVIEAGGVFQALLKRTRCLQSWLDPGGRKESSELEESTGEPEMRYEAQPKAVHELPIAVCN